MDAILRVMERALDLKQTPREGWRRKGIKPVESVADHSYATALLAMMIAREEGADAGIAAQIAIVHDLAEAETGDIVTESKKGVDVHARKNKDAIEQKTLASILKGHAELLQLSRGYHEQKSVEAQIARDASRLDMALQALRYEQQGNASAKALDEFWESAARPLRTRTAKKLLQELEKKRGL